MTTTRPRALPGITTLSTLLFLIVVLLTPPYMAES